MAYTIPSGPVGVAGGALGQLFNLAGLQPVLRILGAAILAWSLAPYAMVYNTLMTAMLRGTPATGSLFMMSFGSATVPAVTLTAFGNAPIAAMGFSLPKAGCAVCSVLPLRVSVSHAWRRLLQP